MLIERYNTWDRVFIGLVVIAVVGSLVGLRLWANHLKAQKAAEVKTAPEKNPDVLHLEAITNVYECERDGQRKLTDRPCGTGVPVTVLDTEKTSK